MKILIETGIPKQEHRHRYGVQICKSLFCSRGLSTYPSQKIRRYLQIYIKMYIKISAFRDMQITHGEPTNSGRAMGRSYRRIIDLVPDRRTSL